jgi:hypothetical protein
MQLLWSEWLMFVEEDCGPKKFTITRKGLVFLEKYLELQNIMGTKSKEKLMTVAPEIQRMLKQSI